MLKSYRKNSFILLKIKLEQEFPIKNYKFIKNWNIKIIIFYQKNLNKNIKKIVYKLHHKKFEVIQHKIYQILIYILNS